MFGRFVFALTAVFVSSSALAADLASSSRITITPEVVFNAWSQGAPTDFTAHGEWNPERTAHCTLSIAPGSKLASRMKIVGQTPKQQGLFFTGKLSQSVTALVKSVKTSTVTTTGWCNGEPELCDPNTYENSQVELTLVGEQSVMMLTCMGNGVQTPGQPSPIQKSQANIPGLVVQ